MRQLNLCLCEPHMLLPHPKTQRQRGKKEGDRGRCQKKTQNLLTINVSHYLKVQLIRDLNSKFSLLVGYLAIYFLLALFPHL